jgi:hypothetical protein
VEKGRASPAASSVIEPDLGGGLLPMQADSHLRGGLLFQKPA